MDQKFILKSKTMIGALIIFISMMAPVLGFEFSQADATNAKTTIISLIDSIAQFVGLVMVVWGRLTAEKKLTVKL